MGRLATDIGGTFTDLVYFDEESGALSVAKSLSTPDDLTRGVLDTVDQAKLDADAVDYFVHGGTTVINAITERTGAKTALVTTEGFRDVLEIARGNRPDLYNLRYRKEVPFVPRRLRFEVRERVDARGRVPRAAAPRRPGPCDRGVSRPGGGGHRHPVPPLLRRARARAGNGGLSARAPCRT